MHRILNRLNPRPMPRSFVDRVMKYSDWGHRRAVLKLYRASRNLGGHLAEIGSAAFAQSLPALVLWGAEDPFIDAGYADKQRRYFPRAEVHVLQGLGHWPFIDDVEAVRAPLVEFLRRNVGQSG
jgi:pimeloyl-ACP methyl ester carboxylesterase